MGLIRLGTGRDAADTVFATVFGTVTSRAPIIHIAALDDPANGYTLPQRCDAVLSTHPGAAMAA